MTVYFASDGTRERTDRRRFPRATSVANAASFGVQKPRKRSSQTSTSRTGAAFTT